jgi:signal transduction histidine kinase
MHQDWNVYSRNIAVIEKLAQNSQQVIDELQRRLDELIAQQVATADVLRVISRSHFDIQTVLQTLITSAVKLCGAHRGSIFLREGDVFPLKAASSTTPKFLEYWAANPPRAGRGSATSRVIASGNIEVIADVLADPEVQMPVSSLSRIRAVLGVPMLKDNKVEGVMVLTRPEPGPFTEAQIDLLQTFADQAVIAIENTRLFDEVQAKTRDLEVSLQQQTATADVLKVISRSAFDLHAVFDTLARSAAELCAASLCGLHIREGEFLICRGYAGGSEEQQDFVRQMRIPIDDTNYLMIRVLKSGEITNIADFDTAPAPMRTVQKVLGFKALLMVPLMREGQGIGLFVVGRDRVGEFSQRQIELVQTFADQAVIAIENARLFEQVQQRTRELSQSLDDLRAAQDRLVQTEKLASLGQLTAGIAHEIKNPLNFVNNFAALSAELIEELNETLGPAPLDEKMRGDVGELTGMLKSNLEKVVQHGKRADSIVKNMLLHSREGSGERLSVDINALVGESLNLAYHGARAEKASFEMTLKHDFDPEAGTIELYPQEISRALLNLISNGFYASTRRKVEAGDETFEPVLVAATRNLGKSVEIRIRDNGTGIPEEIREKIFNPFFTTKPTGEGTGLGLSMAYDIIVKQHGGRIDVETKPSVFTEFTIILPRGNGNGVGLKSE